MNIIQKFKLNTEGRDFIVGDLHGCFTELENQLKRLDFNESIDRLFSVGDLVDRGKESERCLEFLDKPWFNCVRGNHEQMAIDWLEYPLSPSVYSYNGGDWFIDKSKEEQMMFADAFKELPIVIEVETKNGKIGIIHADCPVESWNNIEEALTGEFHEAFQQTCIWDRTRINSRNTMGVKDIHKVYVGHTPVRDVASLGNVVYVDTGAVFNGGKLTVIEI